MAGTFLHTVRTRGMYTGESSRWLMGHASVSRSTPIPDAADSGQTRLEAAVFRALTSCGRYTPNPAGIKTRIVADGTTVVHVDPRCAGFPNEYELTQLIAEALLPCADPDGGLQGRAGVRVVGVDRTDLALTFVDTSARVTLHDAAHDTRGDRALLGRRAPTPPPRPARRLRRDHPDLRNPTPRRLRRHGPVPAQRDPAHPADRRLHQQPRQ